MLLHPDANAFVQAILRDPAEVTTRLVFADWLEETGEASNVAWASYIRLNVELATLPPSSYEHPKLVRQRSDLVAEIQTRLTIPASLFVSHHRLLEQFLPPYHFTATLDDFEIPQNVIDYIPESVSRENVVLPLSLQGDCLLVALPQPHYDTLQKLTFILNKEIVPICAEIQEIRDAIQQHFGDVEYDVNAPPFTSTITPPPGFASSETPGAWERPIVQLVNRVFQEAIDSRATMILLTPEEAGFRIAYRIHSAWHDRGRMPSRLLSGVAGRIALMSMIPLEANWPVAGQGAFRLTVHGARYSVQTSIENTSLGPRIAIDISRPTPASD